MEIKKVINIYFNIICLKYWSHVGTIIVIECHAIAKLLEKNCWTESKRLHPL